MVLSAGVSGKKLKIAEESHVNYMFEWLTKLNVLKIDGIFKL